ncbi:hypothetical protein GCM10023220_36080 [Streptomyces ziwulingensis]|uniref:Uncharacterized protein n=1 Tax=Streptomyces ziwulingensis TaxID=1045501 RepID=A0ABP9C3J9_9ACTN
MSFGATVHGDRLRFGEKPRTSVRFPGTGVRESISRAERTRLPDAVVPGHEYRDVTVAYRLATRVTGDAEVRRPSEAGRPDGSPALSGVRPGTIRRCHGPGRATAVWWAGPGRTGR